MTFPFPVHFYDGTYTEADVNSNGVVNFSGENLQYSNTCLPSPVEGRAIPVYWDDLLTNTSGKGVFTATIAGSPQQFVIEFRTAYVGAGGSANFEVIFTEGSSTIKTVYGALTQLGTGQTEGVQAGHGPQLHASSVATRRH